MNCPICNGNLQFFFKGKVLNNINISYFICPSCEFICTEHPHWLNEAYNNPIAFMDTGILQRNLDNTDLLETIINNNFSGSSKFLDYAGGYGILVRLMRDRGYNFYRYDKYCQNLFANFFNINEITSTDRFELVTALEFFEHITNPIEEIKKIFSCTDSIYFSTVLSPDIKTAENISNWWYLTPETGQHVSFYSIKTLQIISKYFNCHLYSNFINLHILTLKKLKENPFEKKSFIKKISNLFKSENKKRESLIISDSNYIKEQLK
ncbi:MAG: class I SAM-dependent methyltransferase [Candidatus Wallbacteria bacterium]